MSSPSINFFPVIALKTAEGLAKHSKINPSFSVGHSFENNVTTFLVLFANFVFFLEGGPMTVISAPLVDLFLPFLVA